MEFCPDCGGMMLPFEEEIIIEEDKIFRWEKSKNRSYRYYERRWKRYEINC